MPDEVIATLTIYGEARGEPQEGRIAVAEVIRDRTALRYMSNGTVASTCLRGAQFSVWNTHDPGRLQAILADDDSPVVSECREAWRTACASASRLARGSLHYLNPHTLAQLPPWVGKREPTVVIGRHAFYVLD